MGNTRTFKDAIQEAFKRLINQVYHLSTQSTIYRIQDGCFIACDEEKVICCAFAIYGSEISMTGILRGEGALYIFGKGIKKLIIFGNAEDDDTAPGKLLQGLQNEMQHIDFWFLHDIAVEIQLKKWEWASGWKEWPLYASDDDPEIEVGDPDSYPKI